MGEYLESQKWPGRFANNGNKEYPSRRMQCLVGALAPGIGTLTPWKESYDQPRQHIQKQRHYFVNKGPSSQGYGFSSSHVWM